MLRTSYEYKPNREKMNRLVEIRDALKRAEIEVPIAKLLDYCIDSVYGNEYLWDKPGFVDTIREYLGGRRRP